MTRRSLQKPLFPLASSCTCARGLGHGKGAAEIGEDVVLQTKVGARSLSPSLWPLHLNVLLISANRLFICRLRFNSLVFIPPTLSWQACACVKAVSQDWANGSRSACELGVCQGDLHFEGGGNPFSMVRACRQLPQKHFACPLLHPPYRRRFQNKEGGGSGVGAPTWRSGDLAPALCSHTASQGDPG